MKQILFTTIIVCFSVYCKAQNTTEIEYNYIKKGITETENSGLDMKSGYELIPIYKERHGNISIDVRILKRTKDGSIAGTFIRTKRMPQDDQPKDYCLPAAPTRINRFSFGGKEFQNDLNLSGANEKEALLYCMLGIYEVYSIKMNTNKIDLRPLLGN